MYYGGTITADGKALLTSLMVGETIEFTRVIVGSGELPEGTKPVDRKDLVNPVIEAMSTIPVVKDGVVSMTVEIRNDMNGGLKQGFWIREFGVFAKTADTEEILLYYATLGDSPQPINAYQDNRIDIRRYPVTIAIDLDAEIQVTYNTEAFITAKEAEEIINAAVDKAMESGSDRSIKYYEVETDTELNYIVSNINSNLDANSQERCIVNVVAHPNLYYNPMDAMNTDKIPNGWLQTGEYARGSAVIKSKTPKHETYFLMKRNGIEGAMNSWYYISNMIDGVAIAWGENISLRYSLMIDNGDMTGWTLYLPVFTSCKADRTFTFTVKDYILTFDNTNIKTLTKGVWYDIKMVINGSICEVYLDGELVDSRTISVDLNTLRCVIMGIAPAGGNGGNGRNVGMNIDNVVISNNAEFTDVNLNDIQLPGGEWCFEITKTTKEYRAVGYNKTLVASYLVEDDKWLVTDILSTLNRITSLESKPTIYSGTEEPDNFEGKDGDIYIQFEE